MHEPDMEGWDKVVGAINWDWAIRWCWWGDSEGQYLVNGGGLWMGLISPRHHHWVLFGDAVPYKT